MTKGCSAFGAFQQSENGGMAMMARKNGAETAVFALPERDSIAFEARYHSFRGAIP